VAITLPGFIIKDTTMSKRAVLYARVSGDDRKYATSGIESQLADCQEYAKKQGYKIVGEHYETPDKATSGADWLPEIETILKLAYDGFFDVLVVREIDRLARNRFKQMSIENELEGQGIHVEYVIGQYIDSAEGRLLRSVMSDFAEYEREKTLERTKRGSIRSVMAGNVIVGGSNAPFGYDVIEIDGKRILKINEREATIVRLIFRLYAHEGKTLLGI
jgi:site-specific DNA recombinase